MNNENSRFHFHAATKPNRGIYNRSQPNPDAIRLTTKNMIIGKNLIDRFTNKKDRSHTHVSIEKDVPHSALRVAVATESMPHTYKLSGTGGRDLHTVRPVALYDVPNGVYLPDLKEADVFILED